jgi:hypothetical protein
MKTLLLSIFAVMPFACVAQLQLCPPYNPREYVQTVSFWDWRDPSLPNWEMNYKDPTTEEGYRRTQVFSPFFQAQGNNSEPNVVDFYVTQQSLPEKDFHPEDGWELVFKRFGK